MVSLLIFFRLLLISKYVKKSNEFIGEEVFLLLVKVAVKDNALFLTVITLYIPFSLNLGPSIKNFQATKYSMEKSFQKN